MLFLIDYLQDGDHKSMTFLFFFNFRLEKERKSISPETPKIYNLLGVHQRSKNNNIKEEDHE